ncbi:MAG: discoidin domain-containing protein, partial [Odoribacter sp.]|nr:discoidin domain-containing protein [Odoribacter sp.]
MKKRLLWGLCSLLLAGCTSVSPLEEALRLSGDNREHLEQVLRHYARSPADSLKYRAARFLIENMPGHGWYESEELDKFRHWADSVYAGMDFGYHATLREACLQWPEILETAAFCEDIRYLDSTFLITHIDSTFSGAARRPWLKTITFEQFCEYVLPYRVGHERPRLLYPLQDSLFRTDVEEMLGYDDFRNNARTVFYWRLNYWSKQKNVLVFYHGHSLPALWAGCVASAYAHQWRARLLMCPMAMDLVVAHPHRNNRHCWSAMIDNSRVNGIRMMEYIFDKQAKVYRHTFIRQALPEPAIGCREQVPPFFGEVFYRDVTRCYTSTSDLSIRPRIPVSAANGYLCVFNDLSWEPVAWTPLEKGMFRFPDVGRDIVYLPVVFQDNKAVAVSYPFVLHLTGEIETLRPDTGRVTTLRLDRKYPLSHELKSYNKTFLDVVVEASDDSLFRRKDSLGVFKEISLRQWAAVEISSPRPYRYWRIRSSVSFYLGECLLYDIAGERLTGLEESDWNDKRAFDDDPLSYVYASVSKPFVIDLGQARALSKVDCLLRNDGNDVWPGHWYELLYHDGTDWCSLGVKEATERWVEFGGVPANALLWLRDLTTGKQERVFTVTD